MNRLYQYKHYVISVGCLKKIICDLRPTLTDRLNLTSHASGAESLSRVDVEESYTLKRVFTLNVKITEPGWLRNLDYPIEATASICYDRRDTGESYEEVVRGIGRSRLEAFDEMLSKFG